MMLFIDSNFNEGKVIVVNYNDCYLEASADNYLVYNKYTDTLLGKISEKDYDKQMKENNPRR